MKKVLFIANHRGFSKFNAPYMRWFKDQKWRVDNASPGIMVDCVDNQYDIDIPRSPYSVKSVHAYRQLRKIIDENNYDIIHCHTPMGAFLGRLASIKARKRGTKVLYTAHGFHFFKGAAIKNWLLYFPIELALSKFTDALVTINEEDYSRAKKYRLAGGNVFHIDGVGVDFSRFHPVTNEVRNRLRNDYGLKESDLVVLYIGQFIPRKNHKLLLISLPELKRRVPNLQVLLVGGGALFEECRRFVDKNNMEYYVHFFGFRENIPEFCAISDIHVSPSLQEGLAIGNIEAMATGCALVISDIRGHKEVCVPNRNGYLFDAGSSRDFIEKIVAVADDPNLLYQISQNNLVDKDKFGIQNAVARMAAIYQTLAE